MQIYFTEKIRKAIRFATKVHNVDQNQTRKGKKDPYITHPLSLGIILSRAGADEDVIAAGILHDTIEDSIDAQKITKEQLVKEFGEKVARIVDDVTEQDKSLPWSERKRIAMEHVREMDHDSLLVKTADVLHNLCDLIADYYLNGDAVFERFNAPKVPQIERYEKLIEELEKAWDTNPLLPELRIKKNELNSLTAG